MKSVNVEIWSDFVCPWCWIAKRRFEKAVLEMAKEVDVIVTYKSYRLAKGSIPDDFKSALYKKLGSAIPAEGMMSTVSEYGANEGLKYNFDTMRFGDTSDAHALVKSIKSPKDKHLIIERLYQAATTDGIDIFDREVLISLVKDLKISESTLDFDSTQIAAEIARDELEVNRLSSGVPLFIFDGKFQVSGAREVAAFQNALRRAANDAPESFEDVAGTSCSVDGCAI
jgi:predicted DsbA family dithiol-disulfide isomerase